MSQSLSDPCGARRRARPRGVALLAGALALGLSAEGQLSAQVAPPSFVATELVGRPTASSITINAIFDQTVEVAIDYGRSADALTETSQASYQGGYVETVLDGLEPDSEYFYRLRYRAGEGEWSERPVYRFVTQRAQGSEFVFDIQSDSHQGFAPFHDAALYGVAMENLRGDAPDFVVDLGDTFSLDALVETPATVAEKYLAQRDYLGLFAHSAPVFLVLGNHENEEGWNLDDFGPAGRASSLPVLGANARKTYFLNPVPDGEFYTGNLDASTTEILDDHLKEDYYAFSWGDALFVMLDPFWYTTEKPYLGALGGERNDEPVIGDRWSWTLGKEQYDWLAATLRANERPFVFVFAHHLAGGTANYSRGGKAGARYGEWGGYDPDGVTYRFAERRPGWDKPVHELFEETNVSVFFHGHDHLYAMEQHGSVVYQEVPHAANANPGPAGGFASNLADYAGAVLRDSSGYVRVRVSAGEARVQYVRSLPPGSEGNGRIDHEYVVLPAGSAPAASDPLEGSPAADAGVAADPGGDREVTLPGDVTSGSAPGDVGPPSAAAPSAGADGAADPPEWAGASGAPSVLEADAVIASTYGCACRAAAPGSGRPAAWSGLGLAALALLRRRTRARARL